MPDYTLTFALMDLFAFVIGVTVHEFGHALAADLLGDDTPRKQGRLTVNPIDHLDLFGTIFLLLSTYLGTPFGWGKPVMTYPNRFKSPRWGSMIVSLSGPVMNLLLAAIFGLILRFDLLKLDYTSVYFQLLCQCVEINVLLFMFNLIPIPPLDGSKIFAAILPDDMSRMYERIMGQWGMLLFLLLFLGGSFFIRPAVTHFTDVLSNTTQLPAVII